MKKILIAVFAVAAGFSVAGAQEGGVNFEGMAVPLPKLERVQPAAGLIPGRTVQLDAQAEPQIVLSKRSASLLAEFIRGRKTHKKNRGPKKDCYDNCDDGLAGCNREAERNNSGCLAGCDEYDYSNCENALDYDACVKSVDETISNCKSGCGYGLVADIEACSNWMEGCVDSCDKMEEDKAVKKGAAPKAAKKPAAR